MNKNFHELNSGVQTHLIQTGQDHLVLAPAAAAVAWDPHRGVSE
jgi:hypothetical protein